MSWCNRSQPGQLVGVCSSPTGLPGFHALRAVTILFVFHLPQDRLQLKVAVMDPCRTGPVDLPGALRRPAELPHSLSFAENGPAVIYRNNPEDMPSFSLTAHSSYRPTPKLSWSFNCNNTELAGLRSEFLLVIEVNHVSPTCSFCGHWFIPPIL